MKKQILFLAFFVLAMMAGSLTSYGQSLGASTNPIDPLLCVSTATDPLHPFAGVSYIYSLDGSAGAETAKNYAWWATKDNNFMTAPGVTNMSTAALAAPDVTGVSGTYGTTTVAGAGANEVSITWSADILSRTIFQGAAGEPTFVVGYAEGLNCADNIQVYEINPQANFTVDIAPVDPDDNTTTLPWDDLTADQCVDVVQTATYNNTSHEIDMDYGTNTMYFEVAAANFVKNWTPEFSLISGLRPNQTAVVTLHNTLIDAKLATDPAVLATTNWTDASVGAAAWQPGVALTATTATDAYTGVSAFIKVVISNVTEESLTNNPLVIAVDARDNDDAGIWDMEDADCGSIVATVANETDQATSTILPRPQLDHNTVDGNAAAPNERVVKTN